MNSAMEVIVFVVFVVAEVVVIAAAIGYFDTRINRERFTLDEFLLYFVDTAIKFVIVFLFVFSLIWVFGYK